LSSDRDLELETPQADISYLSTKARNTDDRPTTLTAGNWHGKSEDHKWCCEGRNCKYCAAIRLGIDPLGLIANILVTKNVTYELLLYD